jgi:DNA-3-methyladenine glycosylase II
MRKAINHLKKADPVLGAIIDRVGPYRIEYRDPEFQTLVRSIVYQQLSGRVAKVIFGRLAAAVPEQPMTPDGVLRLTTRKMRALGLSQQKTEYIRDLARRTRSGEINFAACLSLRDDEIIERFTAVKGIGVWTVHMFLIFALKRPDVLPTGDLGVRAAMQRAYGLPELPKPADMQRIAESWRPYCSVASWYLWRSLENEAAL